MFIVASNLRNWKSFSVFLQFLIHLCTFLSDHRKSINHFWSLFVRLLFLVRCLNLSIERNSCTFKRMLPVNLSVECDKDLNWAQIYLSIWISFYRRRREVCTLHTLTLAHKMTSTDFRSFCSISNMKASNGVFVFSFLFYSTLANNEFKRLQKLY